MKRLTVVFLIALFSITALAQPPQNERRIKSDLRKVDRYITSLKKLEGKEPNGRSKLMLKRALESIAAFKTKHPGYSISERESYVTSFQKTHDTALGSQTETANKIDVLDKTIREVLEFDTDYLGPITNASEIETAGSKYAAFLKRIDAALTPDITAAANETSDRKIKQLIKVVERKAKIKQAEFVPMRTSRALTGISRETEAVHYHYRVSTAREMLRILNSVFANNAVIKPALQHVSSYSEKIGGMDALKKTAAKNAYAKLAAARMKPAPYKNAAMMKAFRNKFVQRHGADKQILRSVFASNGWQIKRNKLTGIILSRYLFGEVAAKSPDGTCRVYLFSAFQDYNGRSYGRSTWGITSSRGILCENVKK